MTGDPRTNRELLLGTIGALRETVRLGEERIIELEHQVRELEHVMTELGYVPMTIQGVSHWVLPEEYQRCG